MTDAQQALAQVREALADPMLFDWARDWDRVRAIRAFERACTPANITAILAHVETQKAENERLTADRSRLLNAARRAVTALAAAAERTPEFQRDYEMLAGSLAPFRGEWPEGQT